MGGFGFLDPQYEVITIIIIIISAMVINCGFHYYPATGSIFMPVIYHVILQYSWNFLLNNFNNNETQAFKSIDSEATTRFLFPPIVDVSAGMKVLNHITG